MNELLVLAPADHTVAAVESVFKEVGPDVRLARSPAEVIKYLDDQAVDAVVLPVGLDAVDPVDFVHLVREVDSEVPIVLVGAVEDREVVERALNAGATTHVEEIEESLRGELSGIGIRSYIQSELGRHRRLGRLVRDLGRSLFTAETIDQIERLVYDRLVEADLYQFIWLGAPTDGDQFEIHVPFEGTVALSDLPALDENTGVAATERALESGSVEVVGDDGEFTRRVNSMNGSNSPNSKSNRLTGLNVAIVPFVGQETVVGMAVLANDRSMGIDSAERSVLESLGSLVGTAIWLVEVRDELARAKQRVEEFAGLVAHEIRNPLAIAMTQLDLIREGENDGAVDRVESSLDRIDRHVSNLVSLATGLDPETVETRPLAETASAAWEDLETPGAELIIESSTAVSAGHELLTQLFGNLFRNALEQAGEEGTIIRLGSLDDDGFYVADNGPGIPEEHRDAVFEWGYSETAGLGIGLTVVREICRAHGWSIRATEAESGGARFEVSFDGSRDSRSTGDRLARLFDQDETGTNYSSSI